MAAKSLLPAARSTCAWHLCKVSRASSHTCSYGELLLNVLQQIGTCSQANSSGPWQPNPFDTALTNGVLGTCDKLQHHRTACHAANGAGSHVRLEFDFTVLPKRNYRLSVVWVLQHGTQHCLHKACCCVSLRHSLDKL